MGVLPVLSAIDAHLGVRPMELHVLTAQRAWLET
jgi:hypothetical protein